MRPVTAILITTTLLSMLAGGAVPVALAEADHERARRLQANGLILPLQTLLERAQALRPGRILEVELASQDNEQRIVYEIEILDADGAVWELYFDARSGALLKQQRDD